MMKQFRQQISISLIAVFVTSSLYVPQVQAGELVVAPMPKPGSMIGLSQVFTPAHLNGIVIDPANALKFDFLVHKGDGALDDAQKREEYNKLIKYFLAALTVPDQDQWVNLSPYEKNRIIEDNFGKTEMGRDLLAQDYLLKQITSSLMYPESGLGKTFWDKVYAQAQKELGTTNIPVNTFNKVWIVPDEAVVYESGNTAYIAKSHLKVMLEEDYLAVKNNQSQPGDMTSVVSPAGGQARAQSNVKAPQGNNQTQNVIREILLPILEKEVNQGKNFAQLRQVFSAMLLATWYKKALKESLLSKVYADKAKVQGVEITQSSHSERSEESQNIEGIYQQYLQAFKKGVYNYIKEDQDKYTKEVIPRKYFAGGFTRNITDKDLIVEKVDAAMVQSQLDGEIDATSVNIEPFNVGNVEVSPSEAAKMRKGEVASIGLKISKGAKAFDDMLKKLALERKRLKAGYYRIDFKDDPVNNLEKYSLDIYIVSAVSMKNRESFEFNILTNDGSNGKAVRIYRREYLKTLINNVEEISRPATGSFTRAVVKLLKLDFEPFQGHFDRLHKILEENPQLDIDQIEKVATTQLVLKKIDALILEKLNGQSQDAIAAVHSALKHDLEDYQDLLLWNVDAAMLTPVRDFDRGGDYVGDSNDLQRIVSSSKEKIRSILNAMPNPKDNRNLRQPFLDEFEPDAVAELNINGNVSLGEAIKMVKDIRMQIDREKRPFRSAKSVVRLVNAGFSYGEAIQIYNYLNDKNRSQDLIPAIIEHLLQNGFLNNLTSQERQSKIQESMQFIVAINQEQRVSPSSIMGILNLMSYKKINFKNALDEIILLRQEVQKIDDARLLELGVLQVIIYLITKGYSQSEAIDKSYEFYKIAQREPRFEFQTSKDTFTDEINRKKRYAMQLTMAWAIFEPQAKISIDQVVESISVTLASEGLQKNMTLSVQGQSIRVQFLNIAGEYQDFLRLFLDKINDILSAYGVQGVIRKDSQGFALDFAMGSVISRSNWIAFILGAVLLYTGQEVYKKSSDDSDYYIKQAVENGMINEYIHTKGVFFDIEITNSVIKALKTSKSFDFIKQARIYLESKGLIGSHLVSLEDIVLMREDMMVSYAAFRILIAHNGKNGYSIDGLIERLKAKGEVNIPQMIFKELGLIEPNNQDLGGIDFTRADLLIKRDGKGVPLPVSQQDLAQLGQIQGFIPRILEIRPASTLPVFQNIQSP